MSSHPRPTASRLFQTDQCVPWVHPDGPVVIWKRDDRSIQQTLSPHGSSATVCRVGALTVTVAGRTLADAAAAAAPMASPVASATPAAAATTALKLIFMPFSRSYSASVDGVL